MALSHPKHRLLTFLFVLLGACIIGLLVFFFMKKGPTSPIKVGILHSQTGIMSMNELPLIDASLLAIEEINKSGGVLGRQIEPIVVDGMSDWPTFAKQAEFLIKEKKVSVIFGGWTSASRKFMKEVVEKYDHLLFYPLQYEGLERSPNIVYTGATPNQQIIPGVNWAYKNLGKRFFLIGSDYVFPRAANEIIKFQLKSLGAEVVGEEYLILGSKEVGPIIQKIQESKPEVILNTINGDTNLYFFKALRAAGITPEKIPTMSFSIGEGEIAQLGSREMAGDYASWNYFESINNAANKQFIRKFKERYGKDRFTSDPIEAAYFGVHLWAQAVVSAKSDNVKKVRTDVKNQVYDAPEGIIYQDSFNQHTWKFSRIGKIGNRGQFNVIWSSDQSIPPVPYPEYQTEEKWNAFLDSLYKNWGNTWSKQP